MAYESWMSITYLSGLAGEIGVPVQWVTWLMALPWIGSIGQVVGVVAFRRMDSVKRYTLGVAAVARALWLVPLAFAWIEGWKARETGSAFPAQAWFVGAAAVAGVSALFASSSTAAWQSWMKAITPARFQGRFFGVRQRYVMIAVMISNFLAAAILGWKPEGFFAGYAVVGSLALAAAAVSTFLLSRVPESRPEPVSESGPKNVWRELAEPFRDRDFRGVLWFGAMFNGAIQLGGPYFPYYFTREMHVPMHTVALWIMLTNVASFIAAGFWGKRIDRLGDPRGALKACAVMISFSPFLYAFLNPSNIRWVAPLEYFSNGLASAGYLVALNTLLMKRAPRGKNAVYYSVYAALAGFFGALGAITGGGLAQWLLPWGGFRSLWLITVVIRLGVVGAMFRLFFNRETWLPKARQVRFST